MKVNTLLINASMLSLLAAVVTTNNANVVSAFIQRQQSVIRSSSELYVSKNTDNSDSTSSSTSPWSLRDHFTKALATTALVTGALWTGVDPSVTQNFHPFFPETIANAKELASGSGARVNKDPESLLRYGLPIKNKEVRKLQGAIEDIKLDIGSKRKAAALDGVRTVKRLIAGKEGEKLTKSCRDPSVCTSILEDMGALTDPLSDGLKDSMDAFTGSEQERKGLDNAYEQQTKLAKLLTTLEEQMVPANYQVPIPKEYDALPRLQNGRATVEMTFNKQGGGVFDVNGVNYKEVKLVMVVDGYTAPITSGNFVDLVQKGFYDKMPIQRSDGFVVQTGEPTSGDGVVGYVPPAGTPVWEKGPKGERLIPLEIFVVGDKAPTYEVTIEEDSRGGQATVLPFSSYGAMGWARDEYDANSGSSQFFWLLFESDLTPAGKNVLDGTYPCFGYVVEGNDFLQDIKEGDVIVSARVLDGLQYFVEGK